MNKKTKHTSLRPLLQQRKKKECLKTIAPQNLLPDINSHTYKHACLPTSSPRIPPPRIHTYIHTYILVLAMSSKMTRQGQGSVQIDPNSATSN